MFQLSICQHLIKVVAIMQFNTSLPHLQASGTKEHSPSAKPPPEKYLHEFSEGAVRFKHPLTQTSITERTLHVPDAADLTSLIKQIQQINKKKTFLRALSHTSRHIEICLNSFLDNTIPDRFPLLNLSTLRSTLKPEQLTLFCKQFMGTCSRRSCVSLDKHFIASLAGYLNDSHCLEVYAGEGRAGSPTTLNVMEP